VVAVGPERDSEPVRTFRSFTPDLHRLAEWLAQVGITTVAMASTGVYGIPVFAILAAHGFEVCLVNAREAQAVPGHKTDINDAQWRQQRHHYGRLHASFRPQWCSAPTCANASLWWTMPPPLFSPCKRR
jgi:transposase